MSPKPTNTIIEIHDPEIDPQQIMAEIQARVQARRQELGYEQRRFPTFGAADYPGQPADMAYDVDLYHHLNLANRHYTRVETEPVLASSPATELPVVGKIWQQIRGHAHNLVLFYVNRSIAHQANMNRHLVSALNRLTALAQEQQRQIMALREEIERRDREERSEQ